MRWVGLCGVGVVLQCSCCVILEVEEVTEMSNELLQSDDEWRMEWDGMGATEDGEWVMVVVAVTREGPNEGARCKGPRRGKVRVSGGSGCMACDLGPG